MPNRIGATVNAIRRISSDWATGSRRSRSEVGRGTGRMTVATALLMASLLMAGGGCPVRAAGAGVLTCRRKTGPPGRANGPMTHGLAHLHPVAGHGDLDLPAAERAAHDLLLALGVDVDGESLQGTPRRMAAMYAEMLTPPPFTPTTFPNDAGYDELVVATGIP